MMTDEPSIYERLGGDEDIDAVVDEFYERVLADEQLQPYFADVDVDRLRDHQAAFLSTVTGGPKRYDGRAMGAAHDHLDITHDAFDRVADHLDAALAAAGASEADREEVLDVFAGYRSEIVTV